MRLLASLKKGRICMYKWKIILAATVGMSAWGILRDAQVRNLTEELAKAKLENTILVQEISEKDALISSLEAGYSAELPIELQFQVAAQVYDIDWKLVYSIAAHETGWFKSRLFTQQNNPGGIKAGDGWASYDSSIQGIFEMTRLLKKSYIDKGYDTLEKMEPKYCPDGSSWAKKVSAIMSSLE